MTDHQPRGFPAAGHRHARIACLGECMIELRERPDGLLARSFGGDTLNTALYLARLGAHASYVTALGTDPFSDDMLAAWRAEAIGTTHVLRLPNTLPGLYIIQTDPAGERRFSHWRDAAPAKRLFDPAHAETIQAALLAHDIVYLSGITLSLFDGAGRSRLLASLDRLRAQGGSVVFDTNFRSRNWPNPESARHAYQALLTRSDLVLAGAEDHALLHADDGTTLPDWLAAATGEIVVKRENSCQVQSPAGTRDIAWHDAPHVTDTTAAGDSFAAGYLMARLTGAPPDDAAHAGHRLAAIVIGYPGAIIPRSAMPKG